MRLTRAQCAAGEVLELEVGGGDSVDCVDAGVGDGEEFGWGGDRRLGVEEGLDAGDFGVGNVDEEDIGEVGGRGDVHLLDSVFLDEVDGHDLHDAEAESGEQCGGRVAGAVEIGEAVTQWRGKMQARAVEEELKRGEQCGGCAEQNQQDEDEADGEPLADLKGVGEGHGDGGEADQDEDGCEDLRDVVVDGFDGGVDEGIL